MPLLHPDLIIVVFCSCGLLHASTKSLQMAQNGAAGILKNGKVNHFTPILALLYWLSVHLRSDFRELLRTYKIWNGLAPLLLIPLTEPYIPTRALHSKNTVFSNSNEAYISKHSSAFKTVTFTFLGAGISLINILLTRTQQTVNF